MAIPGQEQINISNTQNQASNSDSLFTAFHKIQNNFNTLFNTSSPFNTFRTGNGITANADAPNNIVTFTNTGVTSLAAGTGVAVANNNGAYTISVVPNGNVGVTNVAINSGSLNVSGSPIISNGVIQIELPNIPTSSSFAAGGYVAPNITVDRFGRITSISNTPGVGTVTGVTIQSGSGIGISGGTITTSGTITVVNTGVTSIRQGTGISLTGTTGDITISATPVTTGINSISIVSNTLTISNGTVSGGSGTISVELPADILQTNVVTTGNMSIGGNLAISGSGTIQRDLTVNGNLYVLSTTFEIGNLTSVNANLGNLSKSNYFQGNGSLLTALNGGNVTGTVANATYATSAGTVATVTASAQPNITSVGTVSNLSISGNVTSNNATIGNLVTANLIAGVLTTAAQPNVTSTGTLVSALISGNVSANNANVTRTLNVGNTTLGRINTFDLVSSNTVTLQNTATLIMNTQNDNNTKFVALQAPLTISSTYIAWNLPNTSGNVGQFLTTDGTGNMKWNTVASSSAPSTSGSTGSPGQIAYDSTHIYVCIATNTWVRAAASSW